MRRTLVACEAMDRALLLAVVIDFVRPYWCVTLLQRSARYPDQQGSSSSDAPSADFESKAQTTGFPGQATRWEVFSMFAISDDMQMCARSERLSVFAIVGPAR